MDDGVDRVDPRSDGGSGDQRGEGRLSQEFDVVCLGGGVAGEAIAAGLQDSGLTLGRSVCGFL